MINRGLHEDDDYLLAKKDLIAVVIQELPGAVQVIIPQLIEDFTEKYSTKDIPLHNEVFYIHQAK